MKKLPLYIADIRPKENDGMLALSFTQKPATGYKCKVVGDNTIFSPIVAANRPIYRNNDIYGEHYIMFTPDTIRDMMINANVRRIPFDVEHNGVPLHGVEWVESFQIDYARGKMFRDYQGLTDGTWCSILNMVNVTFPTDTPPLHFLGISVSGVFSYEKVGLSDAIELFNEIRI